ncbi:MAG: signal peptide peptidase SppA [Anaerolineales bacterium]|nr:signal peptide peptidase SppA [Anaerolineales bacterium]
MTNNSFWQDLQKELSDIWHGLGDQRRQAMLSLHNARRSGHNLGYVVTHIGGPLPERNAPPRSFIQRQLPLPPDPLSMQTVNSRFQRLADAKNVRGVVILLNGFSAGLATLQNLRRSISRLREAGKEVVVFTPYLSNASYFVATAANRIVVPPGVEFEVFGLRSEATFFKDALDKLGITFDNIQISPYKSAYDAFDKTDISPELHSQLSWLIDERFTLLLEAMAHGRGLTTADIRTAIDEAPLSSSRALELGLIDAVAYEDELAYLLADKTDKAGQEEQEDAKRPQATLTPWHTAVGQLTRRYRKVHPRKYIGVISLEGIIMMGESTTPPIDLPIPFFGGASAGEATLTQLLRTAEQDDDLAALILHVDSGGGSALASDLIWRQVDRLRQKKPVLVYMGNAAASGGYYVAATANHIMAQTATITGSIGVVMGRASTAGLYEKLGINRVAIQRGARAHLYSDDHPLTEEERQVFLDAIDRSYTQFKQIVAQGRGLPFDELDRICLGRVWTGRQAKVYKLVDSHGDFIDAIHQAAELAGLTIDDTHAVPVFNLYDSSDGYQLPKPYEAAENLLKLLTADRLRQLQGPLYLLPFELRDG